jgi:hypothetical protein
MAGSALPTRSAAARMTVWSRKIRLPVLRQPISRSYAMSNEERELLMLIYRRLTEYLAEFIRKAPQFPGDLELATKLGQEVADLEYKIKNL